MFTRALTVVLLATLALSGCGGGDDDAAASPSAAAPATSAAPGTSADAAPATEPATEPTEPAAEAGPVKVSGKGMKGGCDAMNKMYQAIDAKDVARAQAYRMAAIPIFNDVAATSATDLDTALDGAPLAVDLEQTEMKEEYFIHYTTQIAEDYQKICVAKYGAPALG